MNSSTREALAELLATAKQLFAELGLGTVQTETRMRNPRREPRKTDNLIAAYERRCVRQASVIRISWRSTPT